MEQNKISAEVLKARIEAMKNSRSILQRKAAEKMERIMNRKNKEEA